MEQPFDVFRHPRYSQNEIAYSESLHIKPLKLFYLLHIF